jgi:hypothetical protein
MHLRGNHEPTCPQSIAQCVHARRRDVKHVRSHLLDRSVHLNNVDSAGPWATKPQHYALTSSSTVLAQKRKSLLDGLE